MQHWFGTDYHGRDLLTRVLYGGQISLISPITISSTLRSNGHGERGAINGVEGLVLIASANGNPGLAQKKPKPTLRVVVLPLDRFD